MPALSVPMLAQVTESAFYAIEVPVDACVSIIEGVQGEMAPPARV